MLLHPTIEGLRALRLAGMARALEEQAALPHIQALSFEERLGLLVQREVAERDNTRLVARLRQAHLRQAAVVEEIDWRHRRGLDKQLMASLISCQWVAQHHNLLLVGPTGIGKSWLACALAHKACREGYSAHYLRLPRLLQELEIAQADGRYGRLLATLARTDLVVLDDWGLSSLSERQRHDLLELIDDRHQRHSTIVTSQLPVEHWHSWLGDPTLADAILDRLLHNAYRIELKGDSLRKSRGKLTVAAATE
jgi:DNA replication protein DnaC